MVWILLLRHAALLLWKTALTPLLAIPLGRRQSPVQTPLPNQAIDRDSDTAKNLRQSYLQQAWQQHVNARQSFARDLAIVFVAVLLLSVTFLRGVSLFERVTSVESELDAVVAKEVSNDSLLINTVSLLPLTYQSGQQQLAAIMPHIPCALQERLVAMQRAVRMRRSSATTAGLPPLPAPSTACSDAIGAPIPGDVLADLSLADLGALTVVDAEDEDLARRLLEKIVVAPLNDALSTHQEDMLALPVERVTGQVRQVVAEEQAAVSEDERLAHLGDDLQKVDEQLTPLTDALRHAGMAADGGPLNSERLASSLPSSASLADILVDASQNDALGAVVAQGLSQRLAQIDDDFAAVSGKDLTSTFIDIETTLSTVREERPDGLGLQTRRDGLQQQLQSVEDIYTGPLPGTIALMPEETVRFFPIVLALVLAFFAWRFLQLQHRTEVLVRAFREQDHLEEHETQLFLPSLTRVGPAATETRAQRATAFAGVAVGIMFVLGVGVAVAFAAKTALSRTDSSLHTIWLYLLYGVAGLLVLWTYGLLAMEVLTRQPLLVRFGQAPRDADAAKRSAATGLGSEPQDDQNHRLGPLRVLVLLALIVSAAGAFGLFGASAMLSSLGTAQTPQASFSLDIQKENAPLREFLDQNKLRVPQPPGFQDEQLRATVGTVVHLDGGARVPKRQSLTVRWSLFDAQTELPVDLPFFRSQPAFPTPKYLPSVGGQSDHMELWIPNPPWPGRYYLTVLVVEGDNVLFDDRSEDFTVA